MIVLSLVMVATSVGTKVILLETVLKWPETRKKPEEEEKIMVSTAMFSDQSIVGGVHTQENLAKLVQLVRSREVI